MKLHNRASLPHLIPDAHATDVDGHDHDGQIALHDRDYFENVGIGRTNQGRANEDLEFAKMGMAVANSFFTPEHVQKLAEFIEKSDEPLFFLIKAKHDGQIESITSYKSKADWLLAVEERKGPLAEGVWNAPPPEKKKQLAFLRARLELLPQTIRL